MRDRRVLLYAVVGGLVLLGYSWLDFRRYFPPFSLFIQFAVVLFLSGWAIWKIGKDKRGLPRSPLTWPMIAFLGATTLSTWFSIDTRRSFDGLLATLVLVLVFFVVCDMLVAGVRPHVFITLLLVLATAALGMGVWTAAHYYWEWWQLHTASYAPFPLEYRLFGVFDHPNFLAALLNLALPFVIVRLARTQASMARLLWIVWLLAYVVVLFLTRSRGGMIAAGGVTGVTVGLLMLQHPSFATKDKGMRLIPWLRSMWRIWATALAFIGLFLLLWRGPSLVASLSTLSTAPSSPSAEPAGEPAAAATPEYSTNAGSTMSSALTQHRMAFWGLAWHAFQEHPLTGSGPKTYGRLFVETFDTVRTWVPGYSHSLYFELLGMQGILGAGVFVWILMAGGWALARVWIRPRDEHGSPELGSIARTTTVQVLRDERDIVLAVCGALTGFLIHSLVDIIGILFTNHLIVVMLVATGLAAAGRVQPASITLPHRVLAVLAVPAVLTVVLMRYSAAQDALLDGVLHALDDNWSAAAQSVEEAIANDPQLAFYYGQRGYAYGMLVDPLSGTNDPALRQRALESYAISLQVEPAYIPHLLNMAMLLDQAGYELQGDALVEQTAALPQANYWTVSSILAADRYAAQGHDAKAKELITSAFASYFWAPEMAACRQSDVCRAVASDMGIGYGERRQRKTLQLLAAGKPDKALALLNSPSSSKADPLNWLDRADIHLALGQLAEAEYALRIVDTLRYSRSYMPGYADARSALSHAALSLAQGDTAQAIRDLDGVARPRITRDGYGYGVYHRVGLPGSLLPQVDMLQQTAYDVEVYRQLGLLYEQQGRADDAAWARKRAALLAKMLGE